MDRQIKTIKQNLIKLGKDGHGYKKFLAEAIGVDQQTFSMAWTQHRKTKRYKEIISLALNFTQDLIKNQQKIHEL